MIRKIAAMAVLTGALFAPAASHAAACNGSVTTVGDLYVDDRGADTDGVWVYQESNGIAGLQSGGNSAVLGANDADACYELDEQGKKIAPDTLIV